MRSLLLLLIVMPLFTLAQNAKTYIKLKDNAGQQIKGEVVVKGYERSILANSLTSGGKNNAQLEFTMQISGAAADLKRAMSNDQPLSTGEVYVVVPNLAAGTISYSIKMEQMRVVSCTEVIGCNNSLSTMVILQATRIGWTYYSTGGTGTSTVSRKYGWDNSTGAEWTSF